MFKAKCKAQLKSACAGKNESFKNLIQLRENPGS